jgi:transmembrane sensor
MSEMKSSRGGAPPLARALRSTVDEAAVRRMWSSIERRLPRERAVRGVRRAWLALAAVVVAGIAWVASAQLAPRHDAEPRALVLEDGRVFDSVEGDIAGGGVVGGNVVRGNVVRFADGSRIEAEPGARVEALAATPSEMALLVRRGRARFFVTPGGPRRWAIDARGVRVEVVGTVLTVEASERAVQVGVEVGAVLVRSPLLPDGVQRLSAGQDLRLALEEPVPPPGATAVETDPEPRTVAQPEAQASRGRKPSPRRQKPAPATSIESSRELWSRADTARASGQSELAIRLLEQLLRDHPDDAQAPLGAFTLGTVLAEQEQPERAARAFRRALELGLPSVLRELCLRRLEELEHDNQTSDEGAAPR